MMKYAIALLVLVGAVSLAQPPSFELVIRGGRVIDLRFRRDVIKPSHAGTFREREHFQPPETNGSIARYSTEDRLARDPDSLWFRDRLQ